MEDENIEYKVDFKCFGPYPGKEQSNLHPATINVYNTGATLYCSVFNKDSLMCLKNDEKLPEKKCPFINPINYSRLTQKPKERSE